MAALNSRRKSNPVKRTLLQFVLILYSAIVVYPMLWLLLASLKGSAEIFEHPWAMPKALHWSNFSEAWYGAQVG